MLRAEQLVDGRFELLLRKVTCRYSVAFFSTSAGPLFLERLSEYTRKIETRTHLVWVLFSEKLIEISCTG